MNPQDYQWVPKELIWEMLFMLGMQAQSLRMSVAGGIGWLAWLDEAIKRNNKDKEALLSLL
jgi:hypothetical protein